MTPLFNLTWTSWTVLMVVLTQLTILSVTVYLHRAQSHRALTLHPALAHIIRLWLWLTTGMSTLQWVAVHRKHHAFCDTEQDPHSPQIKGFWTVLLKGVALYSKEARNPETIERFGKGAPADWLELKFYLKYPLVGPTLLVMTNLVMFGLLKGGLLSLCQLLWIPFWAAGIINGLAHTAGYRNFATADASRNISPFGVWIGGEELHNNHHAHPTSAKLSYKKGEFDLGWGVICVLRYLGLAKVNKVATPPKLSNEPQLCTPELVASLGHHRLQVSAWFQSLWNQTVLELKKNDRLSTYQERLLKNAFRDVKLCNTTQELLHSKTRLQALREHWLSLQKTWTDKKSSADELSAALGLWCERAEASGIEALRGLSLQVRSLRA